MTIYAVAVEACRPAAKYGQRRRSFPASAPTPRQLQEESACTLAIPQPISHPIGANNSTRSCPSVVASADSTCNDGLPS